MWLALIAVSKDKSKRDAAAEQRSRDRLAAVSAERAGLQKTLASEFPGYAALSNPPPMTGKEIQALLSDNEAMVMFSVVDKESYVLALTHASFDWKPLPLVAEALSQRWPRFAAVLTSVRQAMRPANPGCSIWRLPMNYIQRCWARSSRS